jgi:hypothetical protein
LVRIRFWVSLVVMLLVLGTLIETAFHILLVML